MISFLLENMDKGFSISKSQNDFISSLPKFIFDDEGYMSFIDRCNGGFFFKGALHLYGFCKTPEFHSFFYKNSFIKQLFGNITDGLFFFSEEIFSNQYAFGEEGIYLFNTETGERELICKKFNTWIDLLKSETDYYTGHSLLKKWNENSSEKTSYTSYLCPKKPFVIGGEYNIDNLYILDWQKAISLKSEIAKQIYGMPDGTQVRIDIKE